MTISAEEGLLNWNKQPGMHGYCQNASEIDLPVRPTKLTVSAEEGLDTRVRVELT